MGWNRERGNGKEKGGGTGGVPKGAQLTIRNKQFKKEKYRVSHIILDHISKLRFSGKFYKNESFRKNCVFY